MKNFRREAPRQTACLLGASLMLVEHNPLKKTHRISVLHFVLHIEKNMLYFNIFYDTGVLYKNRENQVKTVH